MHYQHVGTVPTRVWDVFVANRGHVLQRWFGVRARDELGAVAKVTELDVMRDLLLCNRIEQYEEELRARQQWVFEIRPVLNPREAFGTLSDKDAREWIERGYLRVQYTSEGDE